METQIKMININQLVADKGFRAIKNRKSKTPNMPIIVGLRFDENNKKILRILDGNHRYFDAIDAGETMVKIKFEDIGLN